MLILGISCYYHDSAIAIVKDGEILFCAQEERYTRQKGDSNFPKKSIQRALDFLNLQPEQMDAIVFYEKPFLKFERILETYLAYAPKGFLSFLKVIPHWISKKLFQKLLIINELSELGFNKKRIKNRIFFSDHHLSHAASSFFPSPFSESAIIINDGVGEWPTSSLYYGKDHQIQLIKKIDFPHSLGLLYSTFTAYCGFKVNSGEYKLMGLAPYGKPIYTETIKSHLIDIKADGSYRLNLSYFDYTTGNKMYSTKFDKLFSNNHRHPEEDIQQVHMDLAASIQQVLEDVLLKMAKHIKQETGASNLCLSGGVALNCVANSKLLESNLFQNIWIQPAAGDSGGALGAALAYYYIQLNSQRRVDVNDKMNNAYLGDAYSDEEIENYFEKEKIHFHKFESQESQIELIVNYLAKNKTFGLYRGRMEFGPRALGHRSIIASPLSEHTQKNLNLKIKFRESFRPFAPMVLLEKVHEWFDYQKESPYMLFVSQVQSSRLLNTINKSDLWGMDLLNLKRSQIPAVTHVDNSARLQTVSPSADPWLHNLITKFEYKTGCPILVNTSFNVRGEPIVASPTDALACFSGTDLDGLIAGSFVVLKNENPHLKIKDFNKNFELD